MQNLADVAYGLTIAHACVLPCNTQSGDKLFAKKVFNRIFKPNRLKIGGFELYVWNCASDFHDLLSDGRDCGSEWFYIKCWVLKKYTFYCGRFSSQKYWKFYSNREEGGLLPHFFVFYFFVFHLSSANKSYPICSSFFVFKLLAKKRVKTRTGCVRHSLPKVR